MPRVERLQRSVSTRALPGVRRTPQQEGAGVGEAISQFGNAVARIGLQGVAEVAQEERRRAYTVERTTAERQLGELEQQLTTDPEHGIVNVRGKDAQGLRGKQAPLYDQQADMIAANLKTPEAQDWFAQARSQRRLGLLQTIDQHSTRELEAYEVGEAKAGILTASNLAIANADNPYRLAEELGKIDVLIESHAGVLGVGGPEARKAFRDDARSKIHVGVVERLITLERDQDAADYFAEVKDQISGSQLESLEHKLELASTEGEALRTSNEIWADLGPTDDLEPIPIDKMEDAARTKYANDPKKLKATIDWLRQRKVGTDAGRKERQDSTLDTVWGAVMEGKTIREIQQSQAYVSLSGPEQIRVRDYYQRQLEHAATLGYQAEARAASAEARAFSREQRLERQREMQTWAKYAELSDPATLRTMTRGQILAQLPELGQANTGRLLNDHEQTLRSDATIRDASIDTDMFNEIAYDAGLEYVTLTPGQRNETENANVGRLRATVEDAIAAAQGRKGGELTREEKRAVMEQTVDGKVRISDWFFDSDTVGALVTPEERGQAYVLIDDIDAKPKTYGTAYSQALNYLRGLPGQARKSDAELRRQYQTRIEKAVGRSFSGASRQEIENALKGLD